MRRKGEPHLNHVPHIILCIVTAGIWLIVYIPLLISYSGKRKRYNRQVWNLEQEQRDLQR